MPKFEDIDLKDILIICFLGSAIYFTQADIQSIIIGGLIGGLGVAKATSK